MNLSMLKPTLLDLPMEEQLVIHRRIRLNRINFERPRSTKKTVRVKAAKKLREVREIKQSPEELKAILEEVERRLKEEK